MTEREQSRDERRAEASVNSPSGAEDAADVADVIEQSTTVEPDEDEDAADRSEAWERGEVSDADAIEQRRSVTDPEEDYR
jgi:hypothetical protein